MVDETEDPVEPEEVPMPPNHSVFVDLDIADTLWQVYCTEPDYNPDMDCCLSYS